MIATALTTLIGQGRGIAVAVLTEDREQQAILQNRLEATHVAHIVLNAAPYINVNLNDALH